MSIAAAGMLAAATAVAALVLAAAAGGSRVGRLGLPHPDRGPLDDIRWAHGLWRWEALRALVVAGLLGAAVASGTPPAIALVGLVAPSIWVRVRAEGARDRARRAVGPVVAATEAALRSGTALPEALRRAAAAADPLAMAPLAGALRAFDLGADLDGALAAAASAARDDRSRLAFGALSLCVGERLPRDRAADLLAVIAGRLAFEDQLDDEVRARAAGARQQQRLLAAVVPGLAAYLALTIPILGATLGSELGRYVLIPAAAALEVGGIVIGRRVVRDAVR